MSGHFDIIAPLYDRLIPFTRVDMMIKTVGLPAKGRLLDVGGGTGRVAAALSPFIESTIVVDPSRAMLEEVLAKQLAGVKAEAENLPFASQTFERIIIVDAFHHVFDQRSVIAELWRVLKPSGLLVVEEPDIRTRQVKIIAIMEKIALMRSHFLPPEKIAALFPAEADIHIETDGFSAFVIVRK